MRLSSAGEAADGITEFSLSRALHERSNRIPELGLPDLRVGLQRSGRAARRGHRARHPFCRHSRRLAVPAVRRRQGRFRRRRFLIAADRAIRASACNPPADAPRVCYTLRAVHIAVRFAFFARSPGHGSPRSSMDRTSAS
ncbi:hypothetical protein EMIT0111MI5_150018 [Burkholderia sp. IT-111MI5]